MSLRKFVFEMHFLAFWYHIRIACGMGYEGHDFRHE